MESECSYGWEVDKFSTLSTEVGASITSPIFYTRHRDKHHSSWYLKLYPNGIRQEAVGYISYYLCLDSSSTDEVEVNYELSVVVGDERQQLRSIKHNFSTYAVPQLTYWGYHQFILRQTVMNVDKGFLSEDTLTLHCRVWGFSYKNRTVVDEHPKSDSFVLSSLWNQYINQKLVDVTINVNGKKFRLHKNVLAASSPVFESMFDTEMQEMKQNVVNITDCGEDSFEEFIKFLYKGKVDDNLEKFHYDLLFLADKYAVDTLKEICEKSLCSKLSVDNAIKTLRFADLHCATLVKSEALNFIKTHAFDITKSDDWPILINDPKLLSDVFSAVADLMDKIW